MINVITIGSYAGSQALGEVCHRLVDVFLWQIFLDSLQRSTFNSPIVQRFG